MKNDLTNRNISIDFIKFIAIIGVVIIHHCSFVMPVGTNGWTETLIVRSLAGASVPLFLMASGAVMLDSAKPLGLKKLYFKNILRIIIAMLFWGMVYKFYHLNEAGKLSADTAISAFKEVLFFNHEFHFYYMHMILLVYVFLPITRTLANSLNKGQFSYAIVLWVAFAVAYPTLKRFYPFSEIQGMTTMYGINLTYASIGYGLIGYYLKKYNMPSLLAFVFLIAGLSMTFGLTFYKSIGSGVLYEHFLAGNGIPVCFMAIGIFSLCMRISLKSVKTKSCIVYISKSSFLIYLVHMLVKYTMEKYSLLLGSRFALLSIPINAVINLLICIAIYSVLSKIPLIRKWLV